MNIYMFYEEYDNLSKERKKEGLHKLIDLLLEAHDGKGTGPAIDALVDISVDLEADDYFGTEGAHI